MHMIMNDDAGETRAQTESDAGAGPIAAVASLAQARKDKRKKANEKRVIEPEAREIGGGIYSISASDGLQAYVYVAIATGKHNKLRVTEVYPGLSKKKTAAREAEEQKDLVLEDLFSNIDDAIDGIEEALGLEEDESCAT